MIRATFIAFASLATLLAPSALAAGNGQLYACGEAGDAELYVEIDLFNADLARYYVVIAGDNAALSGPPKPVHLTKTKSGQFTADGIRFYMSGERGGLTDGTTQNAGSLADRRAFERAPAPQTIMHPGATDGAGVSRVRTVVVDSMNVPAISWGGIVRSGPGTDYPQIGRLANGDPVTITRETDQMYQGFPWFGVTLANGTKGYHWGGILCDPTGQLEGTFNANGCQ